ncbi:helix-turn-helix domain-containing protein [Pseudofulvibacter geojedonensis]|uniref:Helix-turn-helix domain-containing protein n=1 Tax=Pseudofulvibacter geojedonensis TaxID=1123758 RepID=A0ABW3HYN3_9FLAO
MSFFGKNIKKIRSVKNLSQQAFADLFGLKRATLGAYEEGRSEPKIDTIIMVANKFSIKIDDILTRDLTVNELLQFKSGITTDVNELTQEKFASIPCITESNSSDYIQFYEKETFVNQMPALKLPVKNTLPLRGYTINNLEMTSHDKGLYPNDIVVGHYFPVNKIKELLNGTLVLVLVKGKLILRRLYLVKNTVVLRADHINIDDKEFDKKDIDEIWKIKYVFYKRIPDYKDDLEDQLSILANELSKIKRKIGE